MANLSRPVDWETLTEDEVAVAKAELMQNYVPPQSEERQKAFEHRLRAYNENLARMPPMLRLFVENAYFLGQEAQIVGGVPALQDFGVALAQADSALEGICTAILCENGPRTRNQIAKKSADYFGYLKALDLVIRRINNDPHNPVRIDTVNINAINSQYAELHKRVDAFVEMGDRKGVSDHALDQLRAYLEAADIVPASRLYTPRLRENRRGRGNAAEKAAIWYIAEAGQIIAANHELTKPLTGENLYFIATSLYDDLAQLHDRRGAGDDAFIRLSDFTFIEREKRYWKRKKLISYMRGIMRGVGWAN